MNEDHRKYLLVSLVIIVVIFGGLFFAYNQYIAQGSADLTISSASAKPNDHGSPDSYTLSVNVHIQFNGRMHFNEYAALSVCSFDLKLNSSIWKTSLLLCSVPTDASETFSGSHNFSLDFPLIPINSSNNVVSVPFTVSFQVYSDQFNVNSSYYLLQVNNSA